MENQHLSEELSDWEQIESPSSVFPPGNHEDLPIINPQDNNNNQHLQEQEPINSSSPSTNSDGVRRWKRLNLGVLQNGICEFVGKVRKYVTCKGMLLSFAWTATGVVGLVMVYILHRRVLIWWQGRVKIESGQENLMNLIREKDKKINQLLLQIAQMNEILLARRTVAVIRVKRAITS